MKLLKYSLIVLQLVVTSFGVSFATGTKFACLNQPLTLNYSSTNNSSCTTFQITTPAGYNGLASPNPAAGNHTYSPGNATSNGTFTFLCSGSVYDTASLVVDTTKTWDSTSNSCIAPTTSGPRTPSATISSSGACPINPGGSSCSVTVYWTASGLASADVQACNWAGPGYQVGACNTSGTYAAYANSPTTDTTTHSGTLSYTVTGNGLYARVSGTPDTGGYTDPIANMVVSGYCTSGSTWDGSVCVPAATPQTIVSWSVNPAHLADATTFSWYTTGFPPGDPAVNCDLFHDGSGGYPDWPNTGYTSLSVGFHGYDFPNGLYTRISCYNASKSIYVSGAATLSIAPDPCAVSTDSNYGGVPCSGICANGGVNYPTCTPKCTVPGDPNYNIGGCLGYCANGGADYPTCTPPPTVSYTNFTLTCGGATSYSISGAGSMSGGYSSPVTLPPVNTGTYTGTCTNAGGSASASLAYGGTISASSPTCTIPINQSTCSPQDTLTWTTTNPYGTSAVTRSNPAGTVFNANNGTNQAVSISGAYPSATFYLYNNGNLLGQTTVTPSCDPSGYWDSDLGICYGNPVANVTNLVLSCTNTTGGTYAVTYNGAPFQSGPYSIPFTLSPVGQGTYSVICTRKGVNSAPVSFVYSGSLSLASNTCTIPVPAPGTPSGSSCPIPAAWITSSAVTPQVVDRNTGAVLSTLATKDWPLPPGPGMDVWAHHDGTNFDLKDGSNNYLFDTKYAHGICDGEGVTSQWSPAYNQCFSVPSVTSLSADNQFTTDGYIQFTCNNAYQYEILKQVPGGSFVPFPASSPIKLYPAGGAPVVIPIGDPASQYYQSETGNVYYKVLCINGPLTATSTPPPPSFAKDPPPPAVSIDASPRTLQKGGQTTLTWTINYPTAACKLNAIAVCANGSCSQAQKNSENALNTVFKTEYTDDTDPNNSKPNNYFNPRGDGSTRQISWGNGSDAVRKILLPTTNKIPPLFKSFIPWQAKGQKTVIINNSMDFEVNCGNGPDQSAKVRVLITNSNEG